MRPALRSAEKTQQSAEAPKFAGWAGGGGSSRDRAQGSAQRRRSGRRRPRPRAGQGRAGARPRSPSPPLTCEAQAGLGAGGGRLALLPLLRRAPSFLHDRRRRGRVSPAPGPALPLHGGGGTATVGARRPDSSPQRGPTGPAGGGPSPGRRRRRLCSHPVRSRPVQSPRPPPGQLRRLGHPLPPPLPLIGPGRCDATNRAQWVK